MYGVNAGSGRRRHPEGRKRNAQRTLAASRRLESAQFTGQHAHKVYDGTKVKAVVLGSTAVFGGVSHDPALNLSYAIRRALRPITVPVAKVLDGQGRHIADISVDPVTGVRKRVPV
jgi:hypothetical protein